MSRQRSEFAASLAVMRVSEASSSLSALWFAPRFAPILERRAWALWIAGFLLATLLLEAAGIHTLGCIVRDLTGVPCPGCGLTTSARFLFQGMWRQSAEAHLFLPVFLFALSLVLVIGALPAPLHLRAIAAVAGWERRTGATSFLACAMLGYWMLRVG